MDPLNAVEARVLGSLVEKDITTPDYYPLTLNALKNACNQSSNRDPVVAYGEADIVRGLDLLREKKLAFMFEGAESRVAKFGHRLAQSLLLERPETAVLCVLLLRGPQTPGEIRGRTGRMHEFPDLEAVEASLGALIARSPSPLVAKLPRRAGMKEQRYAHLLCGEVALPPPETPSAPGIAPAHSGPADDRVDRLERETSSLRSEVAELRQELAQLRSQLE